MKCPHCGYEDPFHKSWFDHEKEVSQQPYFQEWNDALWQLLQDGDIEYEGYIYHKTPSSVERMPREIHIARKKYGRPPQERAHGKNYHLLGRKIARQQAKKKVNAE